MSKTDGGLAFPIAIDMGNGTIATHHGMTLRDYFAAKAMAAIIMNPETQHELKSMDRDQGMETISIIAYMQADAMIRERAK